MRHYAILNAYLEIVEQGPIMSKEHELRIFAENDGKSLVICQTKEEVLDFVNTLKEDEDDN